MNRTLFLDSTPLGLVTQRPGYSSEVDAIRQWLRDLLANGWTVYVAEIADYEVRRELIRAGKLASLRRLDSLQTSLTYLPITTEAMRLAADLWAQARNQGWATADPKALDGDVILAAQALSLAPPPESLIVATENVAHLSRYVTAAEWRSIAP
ncbi:MAG: nucleic acid-binding protein [Armatimonadota bacterium]